MKFEALTIPGAYRVIPEPHRDTRGHFVRLFDQQLFSEVGLCTTWCQEANSMNLHRGVVRGMHWQDQPQPDIKLVRCTRGVIFDVLVDLRSDSPMCGRWEAVTLREESQEALYIPEGCAHGFQALEDFSEVHYLISSPFLPGLQRGLRWDDPALAISWPVMESIQISPRDEGFPPLLVSLRKKT